MVACKIQVLSAVGCRRHYRSSYSIGQNLGVVGVRIFQGKDRERLAGRTVFAQVLELNLHATVFRFFIFV